MPPKRVYKKRSQKQPIETSRITIVRPIQVSNVNSFHRGHQLFPDKFCNILILASKKSGKTTVLNHICKNSLTNKDKLIVFASTVRKDPIYDDLLNWCNQSNIVNEIHEDFKEGRTNLIREFIKESQLDSIPEEIEDPNENVLQHITTDNMVFVGNMGGINLPPREVIKKKRYDVTNIILDDLGQDLRDKSIEDLLKTSRHHHSRVIISTQWLNDLTPAAVRQLDYILIFKGLPEIKISELHRKITTATPEAEFIDIYNRATINPYSFLYIDVKRGEYRNNFSIL